MEYSINALSKLAGVSTRTLRYYDEIGILKPARINSSGYRIYGSKEVDALQMILFYRTFDMALNVIKEIMNSSDFNAIDALTEHRQTLMLKQKQLDMLIRTIDQTIDAKEGRIIMTDQNKFEAFKEKLVNDNERLYGTEIRQKYGEAQVTASNQKVMSMTEEDQKQLEILHEQLIKELLLAFKANAPEGEHGQKAADLHRQWLSFYWTEYSKEAHYGLAEMYTTDERFMANYEKYQVGLTAFLKEAIRIYTGM